MSRPNLFQLDNALITQLFRTEYGKITAVLGKKFGLAHIEVAQDIVSDTFLTAYKVWKVRGRPENPAAWLYEVAKNKTKDYLKRSATLKDKVLAALIADAPVDSEWQVDLSSPNIKDSQLAMIFTLCNPVIPIESQIGLSLRILCGFSIDEIAEAFLTSKENINKRLYRAKERLREEKIEIGLPTTATLPKRLESVCATLYLLFNEGYFSHTKNKIVRKELCFEAMQLTYLLLENEVSNVSFVHALMAIMCFQASRLDARQSDDGALIVFDEQDRSRWDKDLIGKGIAYLNQSLHDRSVSKYHLEASIAYQHIVAIDEPQKWDKILHLYNVLLRVEYSPIAALNRTYAIYKVSGASHAIAEAEKLHLNGHYLYHCLLGFLYTGIDRHYALENLKKAFPLSKSDAEREEIKKKMVKLEL